MAVKKSKAAASTATKSAPKAATKAPAPKSAKADTAAKAGTPKAAPTKAAATKVAVKKAAPVKLTDKQSEFLKQIHTAGEGGYKGDKKGEAKSLEALLGKKLIKKGAKDKASGAYHYTVSKAGAKHLSTGGSSAS